MSKPKKWTRQRVCVDCGVDLSDRAGAVKRCFDCKYKKEKAYAREKTGAKRINKPRTPFQTQSDQASQIFEGQE